MLQVLSSLKAVETPVAVILLIAIAWTIGIAIVCVIDHQSRRHNDTLANCHPGFNSLLDGDGHRRNGWW